MVWHKKENRASPVAQFGDEILEIYQCVLLSPAALSDKHMYVLQSRASLSPRPSGVYLGAPFAVIGPLAMFPEVRAVSEELQWEFPCGHTMTAICVRLAGVWCWCHNLPHSPPPSLPLASQCMIRTTSPTLNPSPKNRDSEVQIPQSRARETEGGTCEERESRKPGVSISGPVLVYWTKTAAALNMFSKCNHAPDSPSSCNRAGFLQKNNSLEERSRIVGSLKERAAKNLMSCDNSGGDAHFRRTETDFSNLFARGKAACIISILNENMVHLI